MRSVALAGLAAALALGAASSGSATSPAAKATAARPIGMIATPPSLLASCRRNSLLRPVCPRRMPAWGSAHNGSQGYYCMTARAPRRETVRQMLVAFGGDRCVFAEWSYENGESLGAFTVGRALWGWDGRGWVPSEWSLLPPPFHVGVDIQASVGSPRNLALGTRSGSTHAVSDSAFDPGRTRAIPLGWVRWAGHRGQLILTPRGACETGDALVLYLPPNAHRVSYKLTLDAWMPAARLTGKGIDRRFSFESGPALPRAIATLKAIVSSS